MADAPATTEDEKGEALFEAIMGLLDGSKQVEVRTEGSGYGGAKTTVFRVVDTKADPTQ